MNIFQALILSVVEGLTEFLPVSSTGHLILASNLLGVINTPFSQSFILIIQLGAIGAVIHTYGKTLTNKEYWLPLFIAFVPTIIAGFFLYDFAKSLFGNTYSTVLMIFAGGVVLLFIDSILKKRNETLSPKIALIIGLSQILSFVPGVSRAAATIIGGMASGLSKQKAVEFSFLLAVPTLLAAVTLDLVQSPVVLSGQEWMIVGIGFVGAFITATIAIRWFITYITTKSFRIFGVWRIVVAIVFWLLTYRFPIQ